MITETESTPREPLYLSPEKFEESFKNVPRLAVNLIVRDERGGVLLVKRNIPPQEGVWHMPGRFLLKNETIEACRSRIARKELGIELPLGEEITLLGAFEDLDGDSRGHVIDLAFGIKLNDGVKLRQTDENSEARFFSRLPGNIGFNHRDTLQLLGFQDE